jgi:hypothetical protein
MVLLVVVQIGNIVKWKRSAVVFLVFKQFVRVTVVAVQSAAGGKPHKPVGVLAYTGNKTQAPPTLVGDLFKNKILLLPFGYMAYHRQ